MRLKAILALSLIFGMGVTARAQSSPYSNVIFKAQTFTATGQSGTPIQLNGLTVSSTVGSSFSSGTITVTGSSLTTVTFSVQGSGDGGATYYAIPISAVASPGSTPTSTVTATGNGLYQINLAGLTHVRFVTSGTFTATNVILTLTASPNASIAKAGAGGSTFTGGTVPNATTFQSTLTLSGDPTLPLQASTKQYVDAHSSTFTGGTVPNPTTFQSAVTLAGDPTAALQPVTKKYADSLQYGCLITYGDSITQGTGATTFQTPGPTATAYAYGLLADYGDYSTVHNYGRGGDMGPDMASKVIDGGVTSAGTATPLSPTVSNNCAVTMMIGTNDANVYGSNTAGQTVTSQAILAAAAWASTPDAAKVLVTNTNKCTRTGTWTADGTKKMYTSTSGATVTCTVTTYSATLEYGYEYGDGRTGSNTITIDGVAPAANATIANQAGTTINTANGFVASYGVNFYPVTAGTHTVVITNGSGGLSEPVWFGSPGYSTGSPVVASPAVWVGGMTPTRGTQTPTITAAFHALIQSAATVLAGYGHNVVYVSIDDVTQGDYDGYTMASGDVCPAGLVQPWHPGDCGHQKIRRDFENAMRPVLRAGSGGGSASYPEVSSLESGTNGANSAGLSIVSPVNLQLPMNLLNIVGQQTAETLNTYFNGTNWVYQKDGSAAGFRMFAGATYPYFQVSLIPNGAAGASISCMDSGCVGVMAKGNGSINQWWFGANCAGDACAYPANSVIVANPSANWYVKTDGTTHATLTTPASSSAACTAGDFTDDANFHYVCTAANTWKRAALSTF